MNQFGKRATIIHIHLQWESRFLIREITKIGAIQLLGKAVGRNLRNHQSFRLFYKNSQEFHNFSQSDFMRNGTVAIAAVLLWQDIKFVKLAMMFIAFQPCNHLVNKIVNVKQFQLHTWVVNGVRKVISKSVTESGYCTVVVRTAPLAKQVWKSIHQHFNSCLLPILQEQVLTGLLAAPILAVSKTTR